MDALPLEPLGYSGTYKLVGGRPSLDFVNTVSWRGTEREHDWLDTLSNVRSWLYAVVGDSVAIDQGALDQLRYIRQVILGVLTPIADGGVPSKQGVGRLNALLEDTLQRRFIEPESLSWVWRRPDTLEHALGPILFDAAELLVGPHDRIKRCPSCLWLFEDQTRNGSRRWCDMADCGSRAKARAYYRRTRGEGT